MRQHAIPVIPSKTRPSRKHQIEKKDPTSIQKKRTMSFDRILEMVEKINGKRSRSCTGKVPSDQCVPSDGDPSTMGPTR